MSLVNSTIDDYVLASFPIPSTSKASNSTSQAATFLPPPPTTSVQYPNAPKQDGRLVVATPGVGVSIYDVSPLRNFFKLSLNSHRSRSTSLRELFV